MLDIYNPFSILNALSKKILADYWFRTGSPTYLVRLLSHFDENINEMVNLSLIHIWHHLTQSAHWIHASCQAEKRTDDEELNDITSQDNSHVLS